MKASHRAVGEGWPVENALVSVVVPSYNASRTLDATLASVRAQSHRHLEILVVDDGSRDDTASRADRHAAEDPRVRVLRKPNGGVAEARNFGVRASRGDFVAPIDSDDLWHPTKIEKQLAAFARAAPTTTYVYCLSYLIDGDDRLIGAVGFDGFAGDAFLRSLVLNFVGNGSAMLIRREAIDRIGGFDASGQALAAYGADEVVAQSLLAALGPVAVVPEWLVGYRRVPGSVSADRARMERAQRWHVDRVKAAVPEAPASLIADAVAGIHGRMAVENARRGAFGAALRAVGAGVAQAPAHALAVMASYGSRPFRRAIRRSIGAAPTTPGPRFADADPTDGARWSELLPFPRRLRALGAGEAEFAARLRADLLARGFEGVDPLGLGCGAR